MNKLQHLRITDGPRRLNFIARLADARENNSEILNDILWIDEYKFTNNSVINRLIIFKSKLTFDADEYTAI
ncbi:hypothetical protein WH47_00005 [Habropoda laboriosa]|uniref:Histone-lysine N-methyltransferase SETMAR n=1 Tax=Habropoda laboriosa TaxID=597456 RepID=A0A0L7QJG3_9HYME|nr:hypothetical protein WH47_00005 [Habropoda laboriosa]